MILNSNNNSHLGHDMHGFAAKLFPICRSITGDGVRETLKQLQGLLPELQIHEVPSGTQCFDWTVPDEWNIRDAYIKDAAGNRVIDFQVSNLHVVSYSEPVHQRMSLDELQAHLYSLPDMPDAIPYVTSYYQRRWGFCLTQRQRDQLTPGEYEICIDSTLVPGSLTYGEWILPGESQEEIFLSTYVCHPSMGNNELSGPVVTAFLAQWLQSLSQRKYTYRVVFIPETIGSIVYLSQHYQLLKQRVLAGFNVSCVGDNRAYSYLPSRLGNTISDKVAQHVLKHLAPDFVAYSYRERGSDERQYCSPGIDLPMASVMRTKYGEYPEYHTSLDNLDLISPQGLQGGLEALQQCVLCLENNVRYQVQCLCEPQLGKRGLYPTLGGDRQSQDWMRNMMDILSYADGQHDLLDIAERCQVPLWDLLPIVEKLVDNQLLKPAQS